MAPPILSMSLCSAPVRTILHAQCATTTRRLSLRSTAHPRTLATTPFRAYPRKDSQDRESINTDATEYSKSGSDDKSAAQERAAFEPGRTDPEEAKEEAGKDVSPTTSQVTTRAFLTMLPFLALFVSSLCFSCGFFFARVSVIFYAVARST